MSLLQTACIVRDVTSTFKDVSIGEEESAGVLSLSSAAPNKVGSSVGGGSIDRIRGKATAQYKEGVNLYARNLNYRGAIEAFDKALEIDEKLPHVWNDRGICCRMLGDYDEALKSFLRAVELAPGNVEILYELGETLEKIGVMQMNNKYLEAAVETFKMVVNFLPNNKDSWNHLGVCFKELGRSEESKFYFDRARDINLLKKDSPIPRKRNEYPVRVQIIPDNPLLWGVRALSCHYNLLTVQSGRKSCLQMLICISTRHFQWPYHERCARKNFLPRVR